MKRFFALPGLASENETRNAELLRAILLIAVCGAFLNLTILLLFAREQLDGLIFTVVALILVVGVWILLRRGQVRLASVVLLGLAWINLTAAAIESGYGLRETSLGGYTVMIIAAGLLLGWRAVLGFTALNILGNLGLLYLEFNQLLRPPIEEQVSVNVWAEQTIFAISAALVLGLALRRINEALARARQDLADRQQAEAALQTSEKRFRALIEKSADGIALISAEGKLIYNSPGNLRSASIDPQLIGQNVFATIHPDDVERSLKDFQTMLAVSGNSVETQFRYKHHSGDWRWIESVGTNLLEDPAVGAVVANYRDITDRKKSEAALAATEERLRALLEHGNDIIVLLNERGEIAYVSPAALRLLNYAPDNLPSQLASGYVPAEDLSRYMADFQRVIENPGVPLEFNEYRIHDNQGGWRYLDVVATNLLGNPNVKGIVINGYDVTERKNAEERLRQSERLHRSLLENIPVITYINGLGPKSPTLYVSPQVENLLGYKQDAFITDPELWFKIVHADDQPSVKADLELSDQMSETFQLDYRVLTRAGQVVWLRDEAVLVRTETGEPVHWLGVWTDITERKQVEAALRDSETLYRRAIEAAGAVPYYIDYKTDLYQFMGEGIQAITGYTATELTPDLIGAIEEVFYMRGEGTGLTKEEAIRRTRAGQLVEWKADQLIRARDGSARWIADSSIQVLDTTGKSVGAIGILQDITERKQAEDALQKSEALYRQAIEAAGAVPYYQDHRLNAYTFMGEGIQALTGYSVAEMTTELWAEIVTESYMRGAAAGLSVDEAIRQARSNQLRIWRSDGKLRTRDGQIRWISDSAVEVVNDQAEVIGSIGILQDITERKQAEAALAQSEERYRLISTISSDYVFSTQLGLDGELHLNWVAGAFEAITGYTFEEYIARGGWWSALYPEDLEQDARDMAVLRANQTVATEVRTIRKGGEVRWVKVYARPLWDDQQNRLTGIYGAVQDVTERKLAEAALRESEELYRKAIEAAGAVPYRHDYDPEVYSFMGEGILKMTGYAAAEITPALWNSIVRDQVIFGEAAGLPIEEAIQRARAGEFTVWRTDNHISTRDGQERWISDAAVEILDDQGVSHGSIGILQDITDRKRAEQALSDQAAEIEALYKASAQLLTSANNQLEQCHRIAQIIVQDLGFAECGIWLVAPDARTVELAAYVGGSVIGDLEKTLEWGVGLIGAALMAGEVIYVPNAKSDPRYLEVDPLTRSELVVPLRIGDKVIGAINMENQAVDAFSDGDRRVVTTFAERAALALENTQLVVSLEAAVHRASDLASEVSLLYRASTQLIGSTSMLTEICERIAAILVEEFELPHCTIWLVDESSRTLRQVAQAGEAEVEFMTMPLDGPGLTVAAARSGQTLNIADVHQDPRYVIGRANTTSELVIPMTVGSRTIGVINLESPELNDYDERHERVVGAFAEKAALAVENTRLVATLEQALKRANELAVAAEEASQIKSQFLTNSSHELRTPLTNIIGAIDIVMNDLCASKEEERVFLKKAVEAAQGLTAIVDDLLEISKIESGVLEVQPQVTALGPILEEAFSLYRPAAEVKQLTLTIVAQAASALIYADPDKLRRILQNLIGNAVKFTEQGSVTVNAIPDLNLKRIVIQVIDTGIGVPLELQSYLFQPFVQADGSTTRRYGGTGLGLTISRRLAQMMNGTLDLSSAGAGQGTTLTLTLPLTDSNQ